MWRAAAQAALEEDHADTDVTSALLEGPGGRPGLAAFVAEGDFVTAGTPILSAVFSALSDVPVRPDLAVAEGDRVHAGQTVAEVSGPARTLLAGERVSLNFLQHLSGIATITRRAVDAVTGTGAVITDTRKTTPGLRVLEKYAVRVGGGQNHRMSLADQVLWKDNHWELLRASGRSLRDALAHVPDHMPVVVEVETWSEVEEALAAGVRHLMLDNRTPEEVSEWARRIGPDVVLEVSGGITSETARSFALAGAARISLGVLTHSRPAAPLRCDLALTPES